MKSDRPRHPLSLLFGLGSAARRLLIPGLAVLLFTRGSSFEVWIMVLFVPAAVGSLLDYASFRYRLDEDEIVLRRVLLFRSERHIPYERIQNLDLVQGPLQRLFGVAEVRIQTAAGGEAPEAHIKVLSLTAIEEMRARLLAARRERAVAGAGAAAEPTGPDTQPSVETEILRLSLGDLTLLGLLSGRGLVLLFGILGLLWQLSIYVDLPDWQPLLRSSVRAAVGDSRLEPLTLLPYVAVGIGALVALRLLSALWAIVRYYGFRLTRAGDNLRTTCGLLTLETATVPRRRIQLLALEEGLTQRLLQRLALRVETAGGPPGPGGGAPQQGGRVLAPLLRRRSRPSRATRTPFRPRWWKRRPSPRISSAMRARTDPRTSSSNRSPGTGWAASTGRSTAPSGGSSPCGSSPDPPTRSSRTRCAASSACRTPTSSRSSERGVGRARSSS